MQRFGKSMEYEIFLTTQAKLHFRQITDYLLYKLENKQAATSVIEDFDKTIDRLSHIAGSLKLCNNIILQSQGYRTIHFQHHRYLMIYRIEESVVYVEGIYHDLQDYENIFK